MTETLEPEVGETYAEMYARLAATVPDFDEQFRTDIENLLHNYTQQIERSEANEQTGITDDSVEPVDASTR